MVLLHLSGAACTLVHSRPTRSPAARGGTPTSANKQGRKGRKTQRKVHSQPTQAPGSWPGWARRGMQTKPPSTHRRRTEMETAGGQGDKLRRTMMTNVAMWCCGGERDGDGDGTTTTMYALPWLHVQLPEKTENLHSRQPSRAAAAAVNPARPEKKDILITIDGDKARPAQTALKRGLQVRPPESSCRRRRDGLVLRRNQRHPNHTK